MLNLSKAIIEPFLFPPIQWFMLIKDIQDVVFDIDSFFIKQSFRNRYQILSSHGIQDLIIPIKGSKNHIPMDKIMIDHHSDWQRIHLNAIKSGYGKSPFFEYFYPEIENLFLQSKHFDFLLDFNLSTIHWGIKKAKIEGNISTQTQIDLALYQDFRKLIDPKPQRKITDSNIEQAPYIQVFNDRHDFVSNLSIIDKLFCDGKL